MVSDDHNGPIQFTSQLLLGLIVLSISWPRPNCRNVNCYANDYTSHTSFCARLTMAATPHYTGVGREGVGVGAASNKTGFSENFERLEYFDRKFGDVFFVPSYWWFYNNVKSLYKYLTMTWMFIKCFVRHNNHINPLLNEHNINSAARKIHLLQNTVKTHGLQILLQSVSLKNLFPEKESRKGLLHVRCWKTLTTAHFRFVIIK